MEQKKKEHIKKMAADRRMAQKFFLIQVDLWCFSIFLIFFSGNGDISNCGSWYCNGQKQTSEVDQHSVLG